MSTGTKSKSTTQREEELQKKLDLANAVIQGIGFATVGDEIRKKLWVDVYVNSPIGFRALYANEALKDYDKKFTITAEAGNDTYDPVKEHTEEFLDAFEKAALEDQLAIAMDVIQDIGITLEDPVSFPLDKVAKVVEIIRNWKAK